MSNDNKVFLEIKNCNSCPHSTSERYYTGDSFETEFTWYCKKENKKKIGIYDWREEKHIDIPKWCPLRAEK